MVVPPFNEQKIADKFTVKSQEKDIGIRHTIETYKNFKCIT